MALARNRFSGVSKISREVLGGWLREGSLCRF
jgi:hypothetical protein